MYLDAALLAVSSTKEDILSIRPDVSRNNSRFFSIIAEKEKVHNAIVSVSRA